MASFPFEIAAVDGQARTGTLKTARGGHSHTGLHAGRDGCDGEGALP